MLDSAERLLFQRLSVFASGWSLEAARAICSDPHQLAERDVDSVLGALIKKSMVFAEQTSWGDRRFRLLEVVREYALSKSTADAGLEARFHSFFNGLAQESLTQLVGPNQTHWAQRMEAEHENLRKALQWAQHHRCSAEMAVGLRRFWMRMGFVKEGLAALRHAVENEPGLDLETEGQAFNAMGAFAFKIEEMRAAQGYYENSLEIWKTMSRPEMQAAVLHNLALVALSLGKQEDAQQRLLESLAVNRELGQQAAVASTLMSLGVMQLHAGKIHEAQQSSSESAVLFRKLGDLYNLGNAISTMGDIHFQLGQPEKGRECISEALDIWSEVHDPTAAAISALCLAELAALRGEFPDAAYLSAAVQQRFREVGSDLEEYLARRVERIDALLIEGLTAVEVQRNRRSGASSNFEQMLARAKSVCMRL
jgi:tetratricopeptide (TPR) repeat protein